MNEVIVKINIDTVIGRRLMKGLAKYPNYVQIENPMPVGVAHNLEDVYEKGLDLLSKNYDVDMRELLKNSE